MHQITYHCHNFILYTHIVRFHTARDFKPLYSPITPCHRNHWSSLTSRQRHGALWSPTVLVPHESTNHHHSSTKCGHTLVHQQKVCMELLLHNRVLINLGSACSWNGLRKRENGRLRWQVKHSLSRKKRKTNTKLCKTMHAHKIKMYRAVKLKLNSKPRLGSSLAVASI